MNRRLKNEQKNADRLVLEIASLADSELAGNQKKDIIIRDLALLPESEKARQMMLIKTRAGEFAEKTGVTVEAYLLDHYSAAATALGFTDILRGGNLDTTLAQMMRGGGRNLGER